MPEEYFIGPLTNIWDATGNSTCLFDAPQWCPTGITILASTAFVTITTICCIGTYYCHKEVMQRCVRRHMRRQAANQEEEEGNPQHALAALDAARIV